MVSVFLSTNYMIDRSIDKAENSFAGLAIAMHKLSIARKSCKKCPPRRHMSKRSSFSKKKYTHQMRMVSYNVRMKREERLNQARAKALERAQSKKI